MGDFFNINGKKQPCPNRDSLSDFYDWEHKDHIKGFLLFPEK